MKNKKLNFILTATLLLFIFSFFFLIIVVKTGGRKADFSGNGENNELKNLKAAFKYKDSDLTEDSNLTDLVNLLDFGRGKRAQESSIVTEPDMETVHIKLYDELSGVDEAKNNSYKTLNEQSLLIFALNEEIDRISYDNFFVDKPYNLTVYRKWADEIVGCNIYKASKAPEDYAKLMLTINEKELAQKPCDFGNLQEVFLKTVAEGVSGKNKIFEKYFAPELLPGEFTAFSDIIYSTEEGLGYAKVYAYLTVKNFGFINGAFESVFEFETPAATVFDRDAAGLYVFKNMSFPDSGANYDISARIIFPEDIFAKIKSREKNAAEQKASDEQIMQKAKSYLEEVNKSGSKINLEPSNKKMPDILPENRQIFQIFQERFSDFPYFQGEIEKIEHGKRYTYSFSQTRSANTDIINYIKYKKTPEKPDYSIKIALTAGKMKVINGKLPKGFEDYVKELERSKLSDKA